MEDDLLSLEMDDVARDVFLVRVFHLDRRAYADEGQNADETPIYYSSLALMTFQRAFGLFPRILGKGDGAQVRSYPKPVSPSSSLIIETGETPPKASFLGTFAIWRYRAIRPSRRFDNP